MRGQLEESLERRHPYICTDNILKCTLYLQVMRGQLEEKRMLVEGSLETGRMYIREEGLEDKRLSADSGEGQYPYFPLTPKGVSAHELEFIPN